MTRKHQILHAIWFPLVGRFDYINSRFLERGRVDCSGLVGAIPIFTGIKIILGLSFLATFGIYIIATSRR